MQLTSSATELRRALARLFDDASQFPPGNLPLEPALDAHRRWRADRHADLVGRFLVPSGRLADLARLLDPGEQVELGVVAGYGDARDLEALTGDRARVTSIELRDGRPELIACWRARAPDAAIFLEGVSVSDASAAREREGNIGAKLRCGGLRPAAFPGPEAVAGFIGDCVRLDTPFKATAGLHAPIRHWDPDIGVHHHGFLNLLSATAAAARGAPARELEQLLGAERLDGLDAAELGRARRWFTAFGTCSIAEPIEGLQELGLLGDG